MVFTKMQVCIFKMIFVAMKTISCFFIYTNSSKPVSQIVSLRSIYTYSMSIIIQWFMYI